MGVEFDSRSVSLAYLRVIGRKLYLLKYGRIEFEPGKMAAPEVLGRLRKLLRDVDRLDTRVVAAINDPRIAVREFMFPPMNNRELLEAVKWKIKEHLSFPLEEAIIDVKITGRIVEATYKRLKVLVVAIPRSTAMQSIDFLRSIGFSPALITVPPLAFENLLLHLDTAKDERIVTLDIGLDGTVMNIYSGKKLEFTRLITAKMERMPLEVKLSLDYYLEETHGGQVSRVVVFGEMAELDAIRKFLEERLQIPVETINPLKDNNIILPQGLSAHRDLHRFGQQLAVALGAALSYDGGINFLPDEIRRETKDYLLAAGARFFALLASFVFIFIYLNLQFHIDGYKDRLAAAEAELETLEPLIQEIEPVESLNKEVNERMKLAATILRRRKIWAAILRQISKTVPPNMVLDDLSVNETDVIIKGKVTAGKEAPEITLSNYLVTLDKGILKSLTLASTQKYEDTGTLEFNITSKIDF